MYKKKPNSREKTEIYRGGSFQQKRVRTMNWDALITGRCPIDNTLLIDEGWGFSCEKCRFTVREEKFRKIVAGILPESIRIGAKANQDEIKSVRRRREEKERIKLLKHK